MPSAIAGSTSRRTQCCFAVADRNRKWHVVHLSLTALQAAEALLCLATSDRFQTGECLQFHCFQHSDSNSDTQTVADLQNASSELSGQSEYALERNCVRHCALLTCLHLLPASCKVLRQQYCGRQNRSCKAVEACHQAIASSGRLVPELRLAGMDTGCIYLQLAGRQQEGQSNKQGL